MSTFLRNSNELVFVQCVKETDNGSYKANLSENTKRAAIRKLPASLRISIRASFLQDGVASIIKKTDNVNYKAKPSESTKSANAELMQHHQI